MVRNNLVVRKLNDTSTVSCLEYIDASDSCVDTIEAECLSTTQNLNVCTITKVLSLVHLLSISYACALRIDWVLRRCSIVANNVNDEVVVICQTINTDDTIRIVDRSSVISLATSVNQTNTVVHLQTSNVATVSNSRISLASVPCVNRLKDGLCNSLCKSRRLQIEATDSLCLSISCRTIYYMSIILRCLIIVKLAILDTEPHT